MKALVDNVRRVALGTVAVVMAMVPALSQPTAGAAAPGAGGPAVGLDPVATAEAWDAGRLAFGSGATEDGAVVAYWTPERMRAAKPIEESPAYRAAVARYADGGQAHLPATPGLARSFPPAAGTFAAPSGPGTAVVNPNFASNHPTAITSGKVFFTQNGGNFVCSATVVNSEGQDTVWTAGHCTHSGGPGGVLSSNFAFVPAFDDDLVNPRPFGTWTALRLVPAPGWTARTDFGEDMSVAIMNTLNGNHIVTQLGGQGLQVNQGLSTPENAFGYPAESPFDGGNLLRCPGTSSPEFQGATQTFKIPCDMTRGSSGGGWLHNWDGNFGFLNGVVSRIDRIVGPTISVSPFFDDTALTLYNQTRNL